MARNYAALPYDYLEEMAALNDAEFGRLTRALLVYSMTGEPIALCGNERFYAKRVMSQEDRFRASYEEQASILSERGKAGAKARWSNAKNAKACLSITSNAKNGNTETNTETKERKSVYRVVYDRENRVWLIKKDGAKRVIASFATKEEALKRVKELCESQNLKVIVHKKDGKFQKK